MEELKTKILKAARDKDYVPPRQLLDEMGKCLPSMEVNSVFKDWWSSMVMSYLQGNDDPTRKTRNANQLLLLAVEPQTKDEDDWDLKW